MDIENRLNKKYKDLDKDDFTEEEFQNLVDLIKFLSKMDRKYNPSIYGDVAVKETANEGKNESFS
jgi:hypothetical protein